MTIKDRGLLKWAPAAFMPEQVALQRALHLDLLRQEKPVIDDYQAEEFEATIHLALEFAYCVIIDVWRDGFVTPVVGRVCRLDAINKDIYVECEGGGLERVRWADVVGVKILE